MRCKNCDYRLWGAHERFCPECHTPFLPSQYQFAPNAVRFCCPHCNQSYYGTGEHGQLVPRTFTCVQCGRDIDIDHMVLFPADGVDEELTQVEHMPWLDRQRQGAVKAWFRTIGMAMVAPVRLMRLTPIEGSGQAWRFALVSNLIFSLMGMLPIMVFQFFMIRSMLRGGAFSLFSGCGLAIPIVILFLMIAVWGLVTHAVLRLTGPTAGGADRTFQAMCYSSGANVFMAVPCLGMYLSVIGSIWWAISAILMIREGQRVHGLRASAAVLAFPATLLVAIAAGVAWLVSMMGSAPWATQGLYSGNVYMLNSAIQQYWIDNSATPGHAIELLDINGVQPMTFVYSPGRETAVPVGGITLDRFNQLTPPQADAHAQKAIAALPPGVIAHRLGDFVFTYHGIKLTFDPTRRQYGPPALWLVVSSPDPSSPVASAPARRRSKASSANAIVFVGLCDGTTTQFPVSRLPAELSKQNALRSTYGLPPLPDPGTVTHGKPALAAPTSQTDGHGAEPEASQPEDEATPGPED